MVTPPRILRERLRNVKRKKKLQKNMQSKNAQRKVKKCRYGKENEPKAIETLNSLIEPEGRKVDI